MNRTLVGIATLLLATTASAATPANPEPEESSGPVRLGVSLGGLWQNYSGENKVAADSGFSIAGARHLDLDLNLALYFKPASDRLLFGIAADFAQDSWVKDPSFVRIHQFLLALSTTYFVQHEIGRGPYFHFDVGPVVFATQSGMTTGRSTQLTEVTSPVGIGTRLGLGHAFKVSERVSLLVTVDCGYRTAGASTAIPLALTGGILF